MRGILATPRRRGAVAAIVVVVSIVLVVLNPTSTRVHATGVFGSLRAPGDPALVAGHRGDRSSAPENTIPAFENALKSDLEFVETDVQLTRDRVPVLIHDETVDRTTNGRGQVSDFSLRKLKRLDAGRWYSKKFAGTEIPTLEEFLELFRGSDKQAMIELKGFWPLEDVGTVVDLVRDYGATDRVVFMSSDFTTLMNAADVAPDIPRIIIRRDLPADPVGLATEFEAIAILTSPRSVEQDATAVTKMHDAGLGLLLYTLNSEKRWSDAIALGVDGIVTDKPSSLDEWLAATTVPGT